MIIWRPSVPSLLEIMGPDQTRFHTMSSVLSEGQLITTMDQDEHTLVVIDCQGS